MHDKDEVPDPQMKIAVFASLPPQEAALLAGLLEVGGIRAVVSTGHGAPGPWTAWVGPGGLGLPATPLGRGMAEVLVDERDLEEACRIAAPYLNRESPR